MSASRFAVAAVVLAGALAWVSEARATPGTTGNSGKPYPGAPNDTCASAVCHGNAGGGVTLAITSPASMTAGATETITVKVNGTRATTSMNAAFSAGAATAGTNTLIPFPSQPDEVGAVTPPPAGATGTFTFTYKAPNQNGNVTMYVAAVSANNNSAASGDGVAVATRTISVTGATTSDAGSDAGSSGASGSSGTSGGTSGTSSGTSGTSSGASGTSGTSGTSAGGDGTRPPSASDDGGCTTSRATGDASTSALLCAAATALVLARVRGRRRAS